MNILNEIVQLMNKEEVRHYKLFTARTNVNGQRKDLMLFDHIRKEGPQYDEEEIYHRLYPGQSKNPYYRLKNRLLSDLNKSLNLQHIDADETVHILHLISLAKLFQRRNKYKVALHYIKKAERKSIGQENYELLDFIYSEMIKLSHELPFINPEEYIELRKQNQAKLTQLRELEDVLAAVVYRMKISDNFQGQTAPLYDLLQATIDEFTGDAALKANPKLRFMIYKAVTRILAGRREFEALETYLLKTYKEFVEEGLFHRQNHDLRLQMIVFIINALHQTGQYQNSLDWAERLREAMEEYDGQLRKKYLPYHSNSLIINYFELDKSRAIEEIEEALREGYSREDPYNEFIYLINLALSYFDQQEYKKGLRAIVRAKLHDGYEQVGPAFRMRIAMTEISARITVEDFEVVERQLQEVRKDHADLLADTLNGVGLDLINLLAAINDQTGLPMTNELRERIETFLEQHSAKTLENFSFADYHEFLSNLLDRKRVGA